MRSTTFDAFAREVLAIGAAKDPDAPPDYQMTKVAAGMLFPKLALDGGVLRRAGSWIAANPHLGDTATHAAEVGGLGILARPAAQHLGLMKPPADREAEKSQARHELAGLGVLAVPSAYALGHKAVSALRGLHK